MTFNPFGATPPLIEADWLKAWLIHEDENVMVFNKPGWVVCHPSKHGPMSSMVGAAREVFELDKIHLVSRLDRETSGLVILAKSSRMARLLQVSLAERMVEKRYIALVKGAMTERIEVSKALGKDPSSQVFVKQSILERSGGQKAQTTFKPLECRQGVTRVLVTPHTGRKHQIRAHADWAGFPIIGDKLYGPDPMLYLEFIEKGWTARHEAALPMKRQALHAHTMEFITEDGVYKYEAPVLEDMETYWAGLEELKEPSAAELRS